MSAARTASIALACWVVVACAPGQIERVEFVDAEGQLHRVELQQAARGADVEARLGRPNAIQRGPGQVVYWLYTFEHVRYNYVLTFRDDHLAHVRYMPRPGAGP